MEYNDILFSTENGVATITINRPSLRNAFRPQTVDEMIHALEIARKRNDIGVLVLTGSGDLAFCSGGDQKIRGNSGYTTQSGEECLNVLEFQRRLRSFPKPTIAAVKGYAIGGGHVLHLICDLTIAADNAIFGQTGPKVGSFDGGLGVSHLSSIVGEKKAREIWFLCRQYDVKEALAMGLINTHVPLDEFESEVTKWCTSLLEKSPLSLRCIKASFNAHRDGQIGIAQLAGDATMMYYMTEEAQEGKTAFNEKRSPDFSQYPKRE